MSVWFALVAAVVCLSVAGYATPQTPDTRILIRPEVVTGRIDARLYGQFLEHIYHSVEDGLYGELIRNRAFAANRGIVRSGDTLELTTPMIDTKVFLGDPSWTDYEYTLKARKTTGSEGFLILVRAEDERNFYWWNIGGWGNVGHQLESEVNDVRQSLGDRVPGQIEAGRWYDIRVRVEGDHIQGWLDGVQLLDVRDAGHKLGRVGVGFWSTAGEYRDIRVTDLAGRPMPLDLDALPNDGALPEEWREWPQKNGQVELVELPDSPNTGYGARIRLTPDAPAGIAQARIHAVRGRRYPGSVWTSVHGRIKALRIGLIDRTGRTLASQNLRTRGAPAAELVEAPVAELVEAPVAELVEAPVAELVEAPVAELVEAELVEAEPVIEERRFELAPNATDSDATLIIEATGSGYIDVDMVSMTRDDYAASGCRTDLLEAVRALQPPIIRWPGGCFASIYRWKRAIGPQHRRQPFYNYVWGEWDSSGFGVDEYMRLCRTVGAEPMLVVNLGSWDDPAREEEYVREALEWIEYCNGDASTPMGAQRAANGHREPYNVVHWEMDNETWALGVERYGKLVARVAGAIKARWPNVKIHACTFWENEDSRLLELCGTVIDYISYHFYENPDRFAEAPGHYEELWKRYAAMIARSPNPAVRLSVTEWNAQSTDWRTGLFAGGYLNVMERSSDVVKIATPALFLRRTDAREWDNAFINHDHRTWFAAPNYVIMRLYRDHYQPLSIGCDAPSGLNVSATRSERGDTVVLKVVNPSEKGISCPIEAAAGVSIGRARAWQVRAELNDRNTLTDPRRIAPTALPAPVERGRLSVDFPPRSVTVIEIRGIRPAGGP
ncbi:MAG: hypothetical protein HUU17_00610 [Chthonomonadales bacterium]|nr:hypothetical protein [Chthonomonadales bacterium]